MTRHFEIQSNRPRLGGMSTRPAAYDARNTGADLLPFPSQSIISDPLLEITQFPNSHVHKRAAIIDAVCAGITGVLLFAAFFVLLFVEVH
jgi:hypothetical protein